MKKHTSDTYFCNICNKTLSKNTRYSNHLKSIAHKKAAQTLYFQHYAQRLAILI